MAELQHRTVSGYVLNIIMRAVAFEETLLLRIPIPAVTRRNPSNLALLGSGPKTAVLLRCSKDEASRIRETAKRRQTSISGFVRQSLKRSWSITDGIAVPEQVAETLAATFVAGSAV